MLLDFGDPPTHLTDNPDIILEALFPTVALLVNVYNIIQLLWEQSIVLHTLFKL